MRTAMASRKYGILSPPKIVKKQICVVDDPATARLFANAEDMAAMLREMQEHRDMLIEDGEPYEVPTLRCFECGIKHLKGGNSLCNLDLLLARLERGE